MIATGANLDKAMWLAVELETIAKQYYYSLPIGGPVVLPDSAIDDTRKSLRQLRPAGRKAQSQGEGQSKGTGAGLKDLQDQRG